MAKKKNTKPAKKKTTRKKKQSSGSSGKAILSFIILFAVVGLVFYGLYETNQFIDNPTEKINRTNSNRNDTSKKQNSNQTEADVKKSSRFNPDDITSKDDMVESSSTNKAVPTYSQSENFYFTNSFDFGWPEYGQSDDIIEHQYFTLSYDEKAEQAKWVSYILTAENLNNSRYKRKDNFRTDPDVSTKSATLADYKGSGFDRGHLAPAADFTWNEEALSETFFMSNMSPQDPGFNRGIWKKLEEKVRYWAKKNDKIFVVTGPITKLISKKIGDNKVAVPSHYYKAILDIQEPEIKAIGFVMKNKKSSDDIMKFALSIDDLERQTGLDFFPGIPDDLENKIESSLDKTLWK